MGLSLRRCDMCADLWIILPDIYAPLNNVYVALLKINVVSSNDGIASGDDRRRLGSIICHARTTR